MSKTYFLNSPWFILGWYCTLSPVCGLAWLAPASSGVTIFIGTPEGDWNRSWERIGDTLLCRDSDIGRLQVTRWQWPTWHSQQTECWSLEKLSCRLPEEVFLLNEVTGSFFPVSHVLKDGMPSWLKNRRLKCWSELFFAIYITWSCWMWWLRVAGSGAPLTGPMEIRKFCRLSID